MRAFRRITRLGPFRQDSATSALRSRYRTAPSAKTSHRASLAASITGSAILLAVPATMANSYSTTVTKRELGVDPAPDDAPSKPHHVKRQDGTPSAFRNIHPSAGDAFEYFNFMGRLAWATINGDVPIPDGKNNTIVVQKPTFLPTRTSSSKLRATWLGHACYYVEYPSGLRVLFDPVFEDRCSPVSFLGPKRYTPRPCDIADLPFVDAVVISHSHYDHLSDPTVRELAKCHPEAHFFVGLGLEKWFRSTGISKVTELDWWEGADLTLAPATADKSGEGEGASITARISCLPSQHCSSRGLNDYNKTLWCSWAVTSSSASSPEPRSVFFGGDTGYRHVPKVPAVEAVDAMLNPSADYEPPYDTLPVNPQFAQIGELRGPFDLGLLPIGAYRPRALFSHTHVNPFDSVEVFCDTKCKKAMGIHWGTWALTSEAVDEPPKLLKMALKRKGLPETGVFDVCNIGESRDF